MRLEIENFEPINLCSCKVLAVISREQSGNDSDKFCGLNVRLSFNQEPAQTKTYIEKIISKGNTLKCWIIKDDNRIPVDIHGGNTSECYFGYINPTIFD